MKSSSSNEGFSKLSRFLDAKQREELYAHLAVMIADPKQLERALNDIDRICLSASFELEYSSIGVPREAEGYKHFKEIDKIVTQLEEKLGHELSSWINDISYGPSWMQSLRQLRIRAATEAEGYRICLPPKKPGARPLKWRDVLIVKLDSLYNHIQKKRGRTKHLVYTIRLCLKFLNQQPIKDVYKEVKEVRKNYSGRSFDFSLLD